MRIWNDDQAYRVVKICAGHYDVDPRKLMEKGRSPKVSHPRYIAAMILFYYGGLNFVDIGRFFGQHYEYMKDVDGQHPELMEEDDEYSLIFESCILEVKNDPKLQEHEELFD